MIDLPHVTLIALTSKDYEGHKRALDRSSEGIRWGGAKIVLDYSIRSIDDWNRAIIYDLWKYVDTEYCFLFHADGYVINPSLWNPLWLEYDFIGAPWPLPRDPYSYRTPTGDLVRVGNSVSLRSRKLLTAPTELGLPWHAYYGNTNEDGFLCVHNRAILESHGIRYAPLEEAIHFSKEHEIEENKGLRTFAFHQVDV